MDIEMLGIGGDKDARWGEYRQRRCRGCDGRVEYARIVKVCGRGVCEKRYTFRIHSGDVMCKNKGQNSRRGQHMYIQDRKDNVALVTTA